MADTRSAISSGQRRTAALPGAKVETKVGERGRICPALPSRGRRSRNLPASVRQKLSALVPITYSKNEDVVWMLLVATLCGHGARPAAVELASPAAQTCLDSGVGRTRPTS